MIRSAPQETPVYLDAEEVRRFIKACRMLTGFQMPGTDPKWSQIVEQGCQSLEVVMEVRGDVRSQALPDMARDDAGRGLL